MILAPVVEPAELAQRAYPLLIECLDDHCRPNWLALHRQALPDFVATFPAHRRESVSLTHADGRIGPFPPDALDDSSRPAAVLGFLLWTALRTEALSVHAGRQYPAGEAPGYHYCHDAALAVLARWEVEYELARQRAAHIDDDPHLRITRYLDENGEVFFRAPMVN